MKVELSPSAAKYLQKLGEPMKHRLTVALKKLEETPPVGDIKSLSGAEGYRLRVGNYRILFYMDKFSIRVHEIGLRGQIYK